MEYKKQGAKNRVIITQKEKRAAASSLLNNNDPAFLKEILVLKNYIKCCLWMPLSHDKRSKGRKSFPISVVMRS